MSQTELTDVFKQPLRAPEMVVRLHVLQNQHMPARLAVNLFNCGGIYDYLG